MADLGQAYVQIVPSAEGISGSIENVLDPEAKKAGTSAGKTVMSSLGTSMQKVGGTLTKSVTLPLAGIGAASLAAFNEVHTGLENIVTKTGASGDALKSMDRVMKDIGRTVPASFDTIGNAVGEVNTRFGVTGDELETLSAQFVKFADLNNVDVTSAIDSVQAAMAAFGVKTEDTGAFLDTLNKAGQDTGVSVSALADDLMRNASAMKELGLNASDSATLFANLNKNGIDTSSVMTGLRKALVNATKDGNTLSEEMEIISDRIKNAGSSTQAYEEAIELFGTKAGPAIADAIREGRLAFDELGTSITDNLGNIDSTFEATLTPLDQFKTTLNTLKELGAEIGARLMTTLQPVFEKIAAAIGKILDLWDSLSPKTQDMIVNIGLIVAAIGPAIAIVGQLIAVFTTIKTAITGVSAAMTLFSGPVGIVIAAIGAAIAVGVLLYQNWDKICEWAEKLKEKVVKAWENIKNKITEFVDTIKTTVSNKFESVKNTISGIWESMKSNTASAWNSIKSTIQQNGGGIQGIIRTAWEGYKSIWQGGLNFLNTITGGKLSSIYNWFHDKFESVKSFVSGIVEWLKGIFNFQWSLPNIQLPHFNIVWHDFGHGVRLPWIGVEWYRKAYDTPYLFTDPTVVGNKGFGDGGGSGEIVYGRDQLMRDIAAASSGNITINVYPATGMNERQLADLVQQRMAQLQRQRMAAWGTV